MDGGGGNQEFTSLPVAKEYAEEMIHHYPNCYLCLDVKSSNIHRIGHKVLEYNGRYK